MVQANPNLQILLNRMDCLRPSGEHRWRCRCPVHGGNGRDSLSIKYCDDGRILIHCFSGCEPLEILQVCGLQLSDIMPERLTHHASPAEKKKWRQSATMSDWEKARSTIQHEARIIWVAGKQIIDGKPLNQVDDARLDEALEKIVNAGVALNG